MSHAVQRVCTVEVVLRPIQHGDLALVLDTWLRTYHAHASTWLGWLSQTAFVDLYRPVVQRLLARSFVRVAADPELETAVVGWACLRDDVLHYVWTRDEWRGDHVARELLRDLEAEPIRYTHETDHWRDRMAPHFPRWRHAPELLAQEAKRT